MAIEMNWELLGYIILGIIGFFAVCFLFALAEQELKAYKRKRKEKAYWEGQTKRLKSSRK